MKKIVCDMESYWPLSLRQIHYQLLNDPPLALTPERSKFSDAELEARHRYANTRGFYQRLSELCTPARYLGHIPFQAIDDPTRVSLSHQGFPGVREFIEQERQNFLRGYHLDKQQGQPAHIEVFIEKNTLLGIVRPVCRKYGVPLTSGRGFAGPSIWRKIADRFEASGKDAIVLIVASDFDPEGFELADDAIRSLRDLWELPVQYHRVAVTAGQIRELGLAEDFNPAAKPRKPQPPKAAGKPKEARAAILNGNAAPETAPESLLITSPLRWTSGLLPLSR